MLKNYFKIAWKVLLRRKFFTFISLFGISFTLMVLMTVTALLNHFLGAQMPEQKLDRILFVSNLWMEGNGSTSSNHPSYYLLNRYIKPLETPELISIYSNQIAANNYKNGRKISMQMRFTDANYWHILDFNFKQGSPFGKTAVESASMVAVITEAASFNNFGTMDAVGKNITLNDRSYKVIGIVENIPAIRTNSSADVWVPYTTSISDLSKDDYNGNFSAMLLAKNTKDIPAIQEEFYQEVSQIPLPVNQNQFTTLKMFADSMAEEFVREVSNSTENYVNIVSFYSFIVGGMLFFMLIPTINLVNINISRIMERSSEIGVRKAFGASSNTLVLQFLFENIFLTLLGGTLGIFLAAGVMYLINNSDLIPYSALGLNIEILSISLLICLFFGLLSGVYPAFKMSKLHPASALKGGSK